MNDTIGVAAWLRDRADSYSRDALVLVDDGDEAMAAAYRAIRDELRRCADQVPTSWGVRTGDVTDD